MILIKNGKVYSNGRFQKRDLYVENGHFSHKGESDEVFDAEGRFIIPGFWDIHTHGAMLQMTKKVPQPPSSGQGRP